MDSPECFDVAIVGAGPAGASAALRLAQSGFSVVLFEKASLPRYKTCGGGVLARAFRCLPPGADAIVERAFNSVALNFLGTSLQFVACRTEPIVRMTMRADLDAFLTRKAQQAGARLFESCAVKTVAPGAEFVEITSARGRHRARFVIAADGVHSLVARAGGWPALPALAPALEHELYLPAEEFARFAEMPRFDFNLIDAGYAWIFPKRDHLSVGILSTRRVCPDLRTRLADYLRSVGITRVEKTDQHGYLIPLAPRPGPLARNRILLVGDTAGLADPVTAEGISHAILSGQFAAQAISEGQLDAAKVPALYQSFLEREILGELRAARIFARVLYRHPTITSAAFRMSGQKLCDFATRVIMGETSYGAALKRPGNYLKLFGW